LLNGRKKKADPYGPASVTNSVLLLVLHIRDQRGAANARDTLNSGRVSRSCPAALEPAVHFLRPRPYAPAQLSLCGRFDAAKGFFDGFHRAI
jgi:hypothetical protein